jgi:hypothetical protein
MSTLHPETLKAACQIVEKIDALSLSDLKNATISLTTEDRIEHWAAEAAVAIWASHHLRRNLSERALEVVMDGADPAEINTTLVELIANPFRVDLQHPTGIQTAQITKEQMAESIKSFQELCARTAITKKNLNERIDDIKDPHTQRKLRQILSHPRELGSLDTTSLGQEEREVAQLIAHHFSLLIDATDMMQGKTPEVKDHSFEVANLRMIEDLARSVENGLGAWEKSVLTEHDLRQAADAFRLQMLGSSRDEYGTNITRSEALWHIFLSERQEIVALIMVKEGKIRAEERISADGSATSQPTFSVVATPILFCQRPEEDTEAFGAFVSTISTCLTESLDANVQDWKDVNDEAVLSLTTEAMLKYYRPLGELLHNAGVSSSEVVKATKLPPGGLTALVKQMSGFLGWYRGELEMLTRDDLRQFGAIMKDLRQLFPGYMQLPQIILTATMYADLSGAKMIHSPSEYHTARTFSAAFDACVQKQNELLGQRMHALTVSFYHSAQCVLNERGRESFQTLLLEGKVAVDTIRLQPLTVLNEKSIEDVYRCIDSALVEDFNKAGAIRFSDPRWYTWS